MIEMSKMEYKKIELEKLDLPFSDGEEKADFIKVDCPSCGTLISTENIDLPSKIGKCTNCQAIFSVEEKLQKLNSDSVIGERLQRPAGVESFYFNNEMELELTQPLPVIDIIILSMVPFIFLFSMLLYFIKGVDPGLIVMGISTGLLAKSIIRYMRRKQYKIDIGVTNEFLTIQQRPSGLTKDKKYRVADIDQVYVKQGSDGAVLFLTINGVEGQRQEPVVTRIKDNMQLKYVEQEIENYLGIKNRPVAGAL